MHELANFTLARARRLAIIIQRISGHDDLDHAPRRPPSNPIEQSHRPPALHHRSPSVGAVQRGGMERT